MPSTTRNIPSKTASSSLKKPTSVGLSRLHAVAAAVVLCTGLAHTSDALALALGRIAVQSALGEPLRAEIDVPDISAEEASSLRVGLASPEAFRAAGMEFNPALGSAQISLQRRPDGRAFLRLTSPRPINEPFVDLIVEANWASGRILRDYTLLIDPPKIRAATPVAPVPAAAAPARPTPAPAPAPVAAQPLPPVVAPAARAPAQAPVRAPAAAQPAAAPQAAGGQVRVRAGDTAGRIANANRPANVSLDQMLVAMLRANPDAFIDGNVNRVKAGSIIDLPGAADAGSTSAGEARQIIAAQSRDFNEFRRSLANRVPAAAVDAGSREAAGRVQAEVQDQAPAAPAQDKLTLSKGDTPAATAAEEKIAQDRQAQDASTRVAELSRNIDELAKLGTTTAAATAAASASPGATPTSAVTLPGAVPTTTETTASTPEADTATATAPTEAAPAVAEPAPAAAPAPLPVPEPMLQEPSLLEQLQENPLVLPAAGGLLALLAGFGLYRMRQRKKGAGVDSSFLESRLQPDSFFGSSGGQRIDTAEASASGSSMVYSPSQLDAAGDVDPVAEADVYLAYGRDLQAEEILKEAMRSTPTRVAIHNKLLEIYAKRRDAKAFEVVATEAYALTQGQGPEWEQACALGKELDPSNPLYQPGGAPAQKVVAMTAAGGAMTVPFGSSTMSETTGRVGEGALDLDLDFSTDEPAVAADDVMSALDDLKNTEALTEAKAPEVLAPESGPMDFDLDFPSEPAPLQAAKSDEAAPAPAPDVPMFDDSEVLPDFALDAPSEPAPLAEVELGLPESAAAATAVENNELMSFDLSNINLDLDTPEPAAAVDKDLSEENPLETKLSLAEEFRAIGDLEGARSLAEEVLAEASGTLKTKASTFLSDLA